MTEELWIDSDEWYPVFYIDRGRWGDRFGAKLCAVPVETADRWRRVFAEFEVVQQEMEAATSVTPPAVPEGGE